MRILHVESGRHLYGGPRQVVLLIKGLRAKGVDNVLACPSGSAIAGAVRDARIVEVKMHGDLDFVLPARLRRLIDEFRPDLVHLHSRRGADWLGAIATRGLGLPVVLSRRVDNPEPRILAALKYSMVDRIIAISEGIRSVLLKAGIAPSKVVCVRSAVPPAEYAARDRAWFESEFGVRRDVPAVAVIAQLIARKGHRELLDAMPAILRSHPAARVLFFGRGPLDAELRERIAQAGWGQSVALIGFRDDLTRILPNLDLVVHPALREGLGIAVLQASQAGIPVVACQTGGIPEAVRDGVTGLLVPPRDSHALADAISCLLADPVRAQALGRAGAAYMDREFGVAKMVDGNLAVYRSLLE